jgi:hypothetical protein
MELEAYMHTYRENALAPLAHGRSRNPALAPAFFRKARVGAGH